MTLRYLSFLLSFLLFSSISVNAEPPTRGIIDGTPVSADDYPYVARVDYDGEGLCTGTLVGTRHVLTAAHCFYGENGQREVGNTDLTMRFGTSQSVRSASVHIHPSYRSREEACIQGEVDAALVVLARDVTGITPVPMMSTAPSVGSTVLLAGFGTQGTGNSGEDNTVPDFGTINIGNTVVEGFGDLPPAEDSNSDYFFWNFGSGESNTASGDSGGPAFQDVNGQRHLAGITCGGDGNAEFGTYSLDTRVDKIKAWIETYTNSTPLARTTAIKAAELYYDNARSDYLYLRGTIDVGTNFKPRGKTFTVKIGNFTKSFRLNADAEAGNSKSFFSLTGAFRGTAFKKSTVRFDMEFERLPTLFQEFPGFGFPVSADATSGQEATIPLSITVDGIEASTTSVLSYRPGKEVWKVK